MDSAKKKELKTAYIKRSVTGGICGIRCSGNDRLILFHTPDIESLRNRYNFSVSAKSCPDPSLRSEWSKYGIDSFSFEVLEELDKRDDQTDKEFACDILTLYDIWLEKIGQNKK